MVTSILEKESNKENINLSKTSEIFKAFYNEHYSKVLKSIKKNSYFYKLKDQALKNRIPKGSKVLDIGCGNGDLLNSLAPEVGVGVDLSKQLIEEANLKQTSKKCKFIVGDILDPTTQKEIGNEKFDAITVVNTVAQVHDVIELFKILHKYSHSKTRIYVYNYSRLWQPLAFLANVVGLRVKPPEENWLPPEELRQMFYLSELQEINLNNFVLFPFYIPLVSELLNNFVAHLPFVEHLCMMNGFTLRPTGEKYRKEYPSNPSCSVVIPCRNEAGHIDEIVRRLPYLGTGSEYIFVEGNSTDNTEEVIKKVISENKDKPFKFYKQPGSGKGDAVREGFSHAKGDIVAILDADITVPPEDLPAFVEVLATNKAEFVNGSRLVYPMEKKAMRFLNLLANKFFAFAFTFILGQQVRDTLCGTKVLWKSDYEEIVKNRSYFGDFDPFGDFDLLFGASKLGLKIIDLPVRYGERTYGDTNISRFRHGMLLFRMTAFAFRKIKMT